MSDDYAANTGTTGSISPGFPTTGEIEEENDRDWFAVTLQAGHTYRIDLQGSIRGYGTIYDPEIYGIHDSNGILLDGTTDLDSGVGPDSRVFFTPTSDGTYYIAAGGAGPIAATLDNPRVPAATGTYRLSVTETASPDDYSADTGTDGAVSVRGTSTGEVNSSGDRDWFAVDLSAGVTYRIDLEGSPTGGGSLRDPYLRGIHDSDGNLLSGTTNDDGGTGRNSLKFFTPDSDGTYYVAAGAYGSAMGTYRVSVTPVRGADDYSADTGTRGSVAVRAPATGEIDHPNDRDWFAVTLEAGSTYRIDLEGSPSGRGSLRDPYLRGIYDSDGNLLSGTRDDDGGAGRNSRVQFTPETDGTYYIAAGADGSNRGTYQVSVARLGDDDYAADTGTMGRVAVGGSATGTIDRSSDRDWFAVTLEAGSTYRIDLEGSPSGRGTLADRNRSGLGGS